ncbi:MAG: hypothetical protein JRH11_11720, partial [Deltaproteobacteria bacterium]|nr:hypothetical protein [Deltaproteobacteria bacterium]
MPDGDGKGPWSPADSANTYQVRGWGEPYFTINDAGHVEVLSDPTGTARIDLYELTTELEARGLN